MIWQNHTKLGAAHVDINTTSSDAIYSSSDCTKANELTRKGKALGFSYTNASESGLGGLSPLRPGPVFFDGDRSGCFWITIVLLLRSDPVSHNFFFSQSLFAFPIAFVSPDERSLRFVWFLYVLCVMGLIAEFCLVVNAWNVILGLGFLVDLEFCNCCWILFFVCSA